MRKQRELATDMNVTPLLDVLLVLLVIFLASIQAMKVLEAQLPLPSKQDCTTACETIVLEVLPNHQFALNTATFGGPELRARLRAAFDGRPTSVLFVKAGTGVIYQDVLSAMDEARGVGVKVLAIATKQLK